MFAQIWIKDNRPEILQFHEAQCRHNSRQDAQRVFRLLSAL